MDDALDLVQWPAMAVTIVSAWLVASSQEQRRRWGFWGYMVSNVLWVTWGFHTASWALVVLQFCLAAMNIRGAKRNESDAGGADPA